MPVAPVAQARGGIAPEGSVAAPAMRYHPDVEWKMDPVLEFWVTIENTSVNIRLKGILDGHTGTTIRSVIKEFLDDGHRSVAMQIDELELPDAAGFSSLVAIQELVRQAGGTLDWSSWPARHVQQLVG